MRRGLKITAWVCGILAFCLLAASLIIARFFPYERVRAMFIAEAQEALKRQVRLGRISWGLFRGLSAEDFALSESPDFSHGTFVEFSSARLRLSWRALFHETIEISALDLTGFKAEIKKGADGRCNFSDLFAPSPEAARTPRGKAASSSGNWADLFNIRRVKISNGDVVYEDKTAGDKVRLSKISLNVSNLRLGHPFAVVLDVKAAGVAAGLSINGGLHGRGTIDISRDFKTLSARLKDISVQNDRWSLRSHGNAAFGPSAQADMESVLAFDGKELLSADLSARASGPWNAGQTEAAGTFLLKTPNLSPGEIPLAGLREAPWPRAVFSGHFRFKDGVFSGSDLALETPFGSLKTEKLQLRLQKPEALKSNIAVDLHFPRLKSSDIPWAKLSKDLTLPASLIRGEADLDGGRLFLSPLTVKTDFGSLSARGPVEAVFSSPDPHLTLEAAINLPAFDSSDVPMKLLAPGLKFPASRWDGDFSVSREKIGAQELRLRFGHNDLELTRSSIMNPSGGNPTLKILAKCRSFDLAEIAAVSKGLEKLKPRGEGFFALAAAGPLKDPVLEGKLKFQGLGLLLSGLPLSHFSGIVSFDERRIDAPNLSGLLDGSDLAADVTIKNYARRPSIDVQASLSRLDIAKLMNAREGLESPPTRRPQGAVKEKPSAPLDAKGRLEIGTILYNDIEARDLRLEWNLSGIAKDLRALDGQAELSAKGGRLKNLGTMAARSALVKVLVFPLLVLQKIASIGGLRLFPNFNDISFSGLYGDYRFSRDVMSVKDARLYSDAANVEAKGTIDIPSENIDMHVTAQVASIAPIGVAVKGRLENPKVRVELAQFLLGPAKNLLRGVLGR